MERLWEELKAVAIKPEFIAFNSVTVPRLFLALKKKGEHGARAALEFSSGAMPYSSSPARPTHLRVFVGVGCDLIGDRHQVSARRAFDLENSSPTLLLDPIHIRHPKLDELLAVVAPLRSDRAFIDDLSHCHLPLLQEQRISTTIYMNYQCTFGCLNSYFFICLFLDLVL